MYTDENLESAVLKGIFSKESVEIFRDDIASSSNTHAADEEKFRLIASFNDLFVVIACMLFLLSVSWALFHIHPALSAFVVSLSSWILAEFFVLRRKMALPAIALLITMVGGLFVSVALLFDTPNEGAFVLSALAAAIGAWLHWKRFGVPITVAAGVAAIVVFVISLLASLIPKLVEHLMPMILLGGIGVFLVAMRWDSSDPQRVTAKSDIAFWLHLTAATLIVHPIFSILGVFDGNDSLIGLGAAVVLYLILTLISLVIDRRAFMVSSLAYLLAALTQMLNTYGYSLEVESFAYVGVAIGFSLLLLSVFWHSARQRIVSSLPASIRKFLPGVSQ
jgi:hypothetical protein